MKTPFNPLKKSNGTMRSQHNIETKAKHKQQPNFNRHKYKIKHFKLLSLSQKSHPAESTEVSKKCQQHNFNSDAFQKWHNIFEFVDAALTMMK